MKKLNKQESENMIKIWNQYKNLEYYPDRICACGCENGIKVQFHHKYYGIPKHINGHGRRKSPPVKPQEENTKNLN